jgi:hypothetical protein
METVVLPMTLSEIADTVDGFAEGPPATPAALRTAVTMSTGRRHVAVPSHAVESPAQQWEVDGATNDHANAERNGQ